VGLNRFCHLRFAGVFLWAYKKTGRGGGGLLEKVGNTITMPDAIVVVVLWWLL